MYNRNFFDFLMDCASFPEPFFSDDDLTGYPNWQDFIAAKMLYKKPLKDQTTCRYCAEPVEVRASTTNGELTHLAYCHECGIYSLKPEELYIWGVDYRHYIYCIAELINGREPEEIFPDFLWNAGYVALGQQSRQVFIARIPNDYALQRELVARLPNGKTPILLVFGGELDEVPAGFCPDRIFRLKDIAGFDGRDFSINMDVVNDQLYNMYAEKEPEQQKTRKNDNRDKIAGCVKRALEEYLYAMKYQLRIADENGNEFKLPRFTEKILADMLDCERPTRATLNRIINSDPLLKGMFIRANDREQIRNFSLRRYC